MDVNVADAIAMRSGPQLRDAHAFRPTMDGVALFLALVLAWAVVPSAFTSGSPFDTDIEAALRGPSLDHWFGTDASGRDIYTRVVFGARSSLLIGVAATALALPAGLTVRLRSRPGAR